MSAMKDYAIAEMNRTRIVATPTHLVRMFGCPETVTIPAQVGHYTDFVCYGRRFTVKRLNRETWSLSGKPEDSILRFGTAKQIAADIGHVLECGRLPHSRGGAP